MVRILGLDVGTKTIGVALSDALGWTAQGLTTLKINVPEGDYGIDQVVDIVKDNEVDTVVVGLPKNMNNSIGPRAEASLAYGEKLQELLPEIEIAYQDERLTTAQAEKMLITEGDVSRKKRKQVIDKLAAVIILQNYLNTKN